MKRTAAYAWIFTLGAVLYSTIEVMYRGFTHWTMTLCGGTCLCLCTHYCRQSRSRPFLLRCVGCGLIITAAEFITGCIVNRILKWNVWDYGARFGNVLGQICPRYTLYWCALSCPIVLLCTPKRRKKDIQSPRRAKSSLTSSITSEI